MNDGNEYSGYKWVFEMETGKYFASYKLEHFCEQLFTNPQICFDAHSMILPSNLFYLLQLLPHSGFRLLTLFVRLENEIEDETHSLFLSPNLNEFGHFVVPFSRHSLYRSFKPNLSVCLHMSYSSFRVYLLHRIGSHFTISNLQNVCVCVLVHKMCMQQTKTLLQEPKNRYLRLKICLWFFVSFLRVVERSYFSLISTYWALLSLALTRSICSVSKRNEWSLDRDSHKMQSMNTGFLTSTYKWDSSTMRFIHAKRWNRFLLLLYDSSSYFAFHVADE